MTSRIRIKLPAKVVNELWAFAILFMFGVIVGAALIGAAVAQDIL